MKSMLERSIGWQMIALFGVMLLGIASTFPAFSNAGAHRISDTERFIGAWRLVKLEAPPSAPASPGAGLTGTLIYTRDGHMSVQLMYPASASSLSNEYVERGYEASFGRYVIDDSSRRVTHHVEGSITRERLVGKDLVRTYQFTPEGRLVIHSVDPSEHWSVTWEHY